MVLRIYFAKCFSSCEYDISNGSIDSIIRFVLLVVLLCGATGIATVTTTVF